MGGIRDIPVIGSLLHRVKRRFFRRRFNGSRRYWEDRYARGGDSGAGSYKELARFKAEILNAFVRDNGTRRVIEFGCGDGNQLALADYPAYTGFDVSDTAIALCRARFAGRGDLSFRPLGEYDGERADLALSLDVIYHLVEDPVFERHMTLLFESAERHVIIYSSNTDENPPGIEPHVRQRRFTDWIDTHMPGWRLVRRIPNRFPFDPGSGRGSLADFYIYERRPGAPAAPPAG